MYELSIHLLMVVKPNRINWRILRTLEKARNVLLRVMFIIIM